MTVTPPHRRATLVEVARIAGVSHQTVSRYFRDIDGLKPDTRARIAGAVEALNYRPNLVARSMRTRRTGRLAIVIPAVTYNPARMLTGASAAAHDAGFVVEVLSVDGGAASRTERMVELADSGQVEGILSLAPILPRDERRLPEGAAIVISPDFDDEMRGVGELADGSPVAELVEHLAALGHRRFLHIAGSSSFASARGRTQSYLEAIDRLGLASAGVIDGDWSAESGLRAVRGLTEGPHRPTAIIAANDIVAAGAIRAARERGWRVPDDVSVTGWDDNPVGRYLSPALTTVDVDLERLGRHAMLRLIAAVRGHEHPPAEGGLHRVIWRESTGAAPADAG